MELLLVLVAGQIELSGWGYVAVALTLTHITIVSVTIFLHRHQAHNSITLHPLISHFFRFWIWLTSGNGWQFTASIMLNARPKMIRIALRYRGSEKFCGRAGRYTTRRPDNGISLISMVMVLRMTGWNVTSMGAIQLSVS